MTLIQERVFDISNREHAMNRNSLANLSKRGRPRTGTVIQEDGSLRPGSYTIDPKTGCWRWNFSLNGYTPQGVQRLPDGRYVGVNVRRRVWEQAFPDIPVPARIAPSCGNKRCIAPDHLIADTWKGQRAQKMAEMSNGGMTPSEIAQKMQVSRAAVYQALRSRGVQVVKKSTPKNTSNRRAALMLPADIQQPERVNDRDWGIFLAAREKSHAEVARDTDLTRERIRQITDRVLRMLLIAEFQKGRKV